MAVHSPQLILDSLMGYGLSGAYGNDTLGDHYLQIHFLFGFVWRNDTGLSYFNVPYIFYLDLYGEVIRGHPILMFYTFSVWICMEKWYYSNVLYIFCLDLYGKVVLF